MDGYPQALRSFASTGGFLSGAWQIPGSWAFPLGLALRVAGIVYLLALAGILFTYINKRWQLRVGPAFHQRSAGGNRRIFQSLAPSLGVSRSQLLVLSGVTSPATFGWIRPTILLPDICLEQDRSELEDILRHELHRVCRRDFVWNGFAILWRALLFFHPAAWYAVRRMQLDRELACDLAVVSQDSGKKSDVCGVLNSLRSIKSIRRPQNLGFRFRGISTFEGSYPLDPGWITEALWLANLPACRLWTGSPYGFLGIAPYLAVLISYAHQQISATIACGISVSRQAAKTGITATRKVRSPWITCFKERRHAVASLGGAEAGQPPQPRRIRQTVGRGHCSGVKWARFSTSPSPFTVCCPWRPWKAADHRFVRSEWFGPASKSEDRNQAIQQSATAVFGLYGRLSGADRH